MRSMTMYLVMRRRSSFASGVYRWTYCCSSRLSLRLNMRAWSRLRRRSTWSMRRRCSSLRRSSSRSSSRSASIWVRCSWIGVMIGSSAIWRSSLARGGHGASDQPLDELGELVDAERLGQDVDVADALELRRAIAEGGDIGRADEDRYIGQARIGPREGNDLPARCSTKQEIHDHEIRLGRGELVDAGGSLGEGENLVTGVLVEDRGDQLQEFGVVVQDADAGAAGG